ncbi:hypothetical protein Dimus_005315, partial [Dionaea muscipula]
AYKEKCLHRPRRCWSVTLRKFKLLKKKKGKSMPSRRSGRITSGVVSTKETVKVSKKKRKVEPMREKKETDQSVHKEPITKRKHDVNAGEDSAELLSEMLKKARQYGKAAEKPWQKKKESSRGVDPSAEKKQKTEKKKSKRKEKNTESSVEFDSKSEKEVLPALPVDIIMRKRVIRGKIINKKWMIENGLGDLFELIKRQR